MNEKKHWSTRRHLQQQLRCVHCCLDAELLGQARRVDERASRTNEAVVPISRGIVRVLIGTKVLQHRSAVARRRDVDLVLTRDDARRQRGRADERDHNVVAVAVEQAPRQHSERSGRDEPRRSEGVLRLAELVAERVRQQERQLGRERYALDDRRLRTHGQGGNRVAEQGSGARLEAAQVRNEVQVARSELQGCEDGGDVIRRLEVLSVGIAGDANAAAGGDSELVAAAQALGAPVENRATEVGASGGARSKRQVNAGD